MAEREWTIGELIGARLRELRLEAEMTQEMIAEATRIHRPVVARIESGIMEPSLDTVYRYADALGVTVDVVVVVMEPSWREAHDWRPDSADLWHLRYDAGTGRRVATRKRS